MRGTDMSRLLYTDFEDVKAPPAGFAWISLLQVLPGSLSSCARKPPRPPRTPPQVQYRRGASAPPPTWSSTSRWTSTSCTSSISRCWAPPASSRHRRQSAPWTSILQVRVPLHAAELPFSPWSSRRECRAARGLLLRVRVPPHAPGRFASIFEELHGTRRPKSTRSLHRCLLARSSKTVFVEA